MGLGILQSRSYVVVLERELGMWVKSQEVSSRFGDIDRKRKRPEAVTQRHYCPIWGGAAGSVEGGALKPYP